MHATFPTILAACEHILSTLPQTSHGAAEYVLSQLGVASFETVDIVAHCLDSEFADRAFWAGEFSFACAEVSA
jgi:hypothetical protein